jgi:hypothetical protein
MKVHIFSAKVLLKCFIEFESEADRDNALKNFTETNYSFGKISVYPSKKKTILYFREEHGSERTADYIEYQHFPQQTTQDIPVCSYMTSPSERSRVSTFNRHNSDSIPHFDNTENYQDYNSNESYFRTNEMHRSHLPPGMHIYPSRTISKFPHLLQTEAAIVSQEQTSKVLIMHKVANPKFTTRVIMNIYGCFGNVMKVLINRVSNYALIELETETQARNCMANLNKQFLFGQTLKIRKSNYDTLSFRSLEEGNNANVVFETEMRKNHRYRPTLGIKSNPPSTMLHLTSVPDAMDIHLLNEMLLQIRKPIYMTELPKRGINSKMYLLEYENKSDSIEVLAEFHNYKVDDKILKFSFSQTKIGRKRLP